MKRATTSDDDERRAPDLSGGCLRHTYAAVVRAVVPPVVASRPIWRSLLLCSRQNDLFQAQYFPYFYALTDDAFLCKGSA